jgi:hypothetical protein
MGTRNLICIWYKGRFMVAQYCQWDGYLEGQGAKILEFLLVPGNIERLKKGLTRITPVDDETVNEILGKHRYSTFKGNKKVCECGAAVRFQESPNCFPPTLNRDTGAKIFDIIAAARIDDYIPIHLQVEFARDGLFCEYCYCIDLDAEVFEVFGGATDLPDNKDDEKAEQIGKNRFLEVCKDAMPLPLLEEMKPSMPFFLKSWPLGQLPKDLEDMLTRVAADNIGVFEVHRNEDDDDEDAEDDKEKSEAKEDDKKDADDKKAGADDKAMDDGHDKKSPRGSVKKPDHEDKKAADEDAQKPGDEEKKTVVPHEDNEIGDDEKERAEYEKKIANIAEDLLIESAQQSIRMERERAAMTEAGTAGDKNRTFTLSIRETK